MPAPGHADPGTGERRSLFGRLSALIGAPLLLGSRATATLAAAAEAQPGPASSPSRGVRIAAPDHSVKRRG